MLTLEYFFTCPHCGEEISMILDLSVTPQEYIEDCEVCCRPVKLSFEIEDGQPITFNASVVE